MGVFLVTFIAVTVLSWWALRLWTNSPARLDKRLQQYAGGYSQPLAVEESGDPMVTAIRDAPPRPPKPPKPNNPMSRWLWRRKQKQRQDAFLKQIVDALTLMCSSLRAGYSFIQAMETVSKEMPPPIGEEFGQAVHEMSLGVTVEESLMAMVERVELDDLELLVTAVLVQRQVGGNLAEVLEKIAYTIRERIRIQGEIRTLTAQGRISGWVIGMLPMGLALMISMVNPQYMSVLITRPIGWVLLGFGLVNQLIGVLLIRKIIQIEV